MTENQNPDAQLVAQPGEVRMTLQIKRAATGLTEEVQLVGHLTPETETPKEIENGSNS